CAWPCDVGENSMVPNWATPISRWPSRQDPPCRRATRLATRTRSSRVTRIGSGHFLPPFGHESAVYTFLLLPAGPQAMEKPAALPAPGYPACRGGGPEAGAGRLIF